MPGGVQYFDFPVLQLSQLSVAPSNWSELTPANSNCTYGVQWIWYVMGQCVVDTRGMVAIACGLVSLFAWIMSGLPQIVENFRTGIPDQALSPFLILFWTFGDSTNLIGCLLTHQLILQVAVSVYGVGCDLVLLGQFLFYKMRHHCILQRVSEALGDGAVYMEDNPNEADPAAMDTEPLLNVSTPSHRALAVCFVGLVGLTTFHTLLPAFPESPHAIPSPFSRRLLVFTPPEASETVVTHSSYQQDWHPPFLPGTNAKIGYMLGWISSLMYFGSRFPQIFKNWRRRSTEGLCPALFFASLLGNTSYGLQIFVTSTEPIYLLQALPWLVGSVGVLALDMIATLDKHEACENWRAKDRLRSSLLAIFPCALLGKIVTVTLLDETRVTGRLSSCDGMMNLVLDGGVNIRRRCANSDDEIIRIKEITIFGKRIRYVTIPDTVDVQRSLEKWDFETISSTITLDHSKRMVGRPMRARDRCAALRSRTETVSTKANENKSVSEANNKASSLLMKGQSLQLDARQHRPVLLPPNFAHETVP
ncbi:hypothetical protein CRM22_005875 [Opisthorchis felineus]|uniref:Sm domain-containing protein n=1 Tax=Opisthorchis felineus TaxID=147828 RepID=A0A4S2LNV0_OPIFE|nr:hypothetical protein CRM22_005875 [Opisthorchis felineus]